MQDAYGNNVDLGIYKGKVLLVINVASKWLDNLATYVWSIDHFSSTYKRFFLTVDWRIPTMMN